MSNLYSSHNFSCQRETFYIDPFIFLEQALHLMKDFSDSQNDISDFQQVSV